ncbi:tyrosine-type recombinase/integrase [Streptosporangium sandarakinum]
MSIHGIRHSVTTTLLDAGENLSVLQVLLGHAGPDTTQVYADPDTLNRSPADTIGQRNAAPAMPAESVSARPGSGRDAGRSRVPAEAASRPPRQVMAGAVAPSWSHPVRRPAQFGGGRGQAGGITSGPAWLRRSGTP